jgi:predicted AAA+ superfamily ATPase
MINRPEYLEALKRHKDKSNLMKVITGVRRCGKSTLLELFRNYLRTTGISDEQMVSLNLELKENAEFRNGNTLYKYIKERTEGNKQYYVFLDELQLASDYEDVANSLRLRKNIDLYITGSNSYIQSIIYICFCACYAGAARGFTTRATSHSPLARRVNQHFLHSRYVQKNSAII